MKTIHLPLKTNSYNIYIENNLLSNLKKLLMNQTIGKVLIISQFNIMELYGFKLIKYLKILGYKVEYITLPIGEAAKSINEYNRSVEQMIELDCDRSTSIFALGGGVVGDVAGFIASTFMRGIAYYQIPTTLLSMVDSSVGGKTGLNTPLGKNLIGSIYQPKGVIVDPTLLNSLPNEEINSGLGEVIKYGAIKDLNLLKALNLWLNDINKFPYEEAIYDCLKIKADIVAKDEKETGIRKILNFGHTIGHALESHFGYHKLKHGEAVSYGMLCSAKISRKLNFISKNEEQFLSGLIKKLPLPPINSPDIETLFPFILNDKKVFNKKIHFILLEKLGKAFINTDVTKEIMKDSLNII